MNKYKGRRAKPPAFRIDVITDTLFNDLDSADDWKGFCAEFSCTNNSHDPEYQDNNVASKADPADYSADSCKNADEC